jgi:membrane protease subunit HflC
VQVIDVQIKRADLPEGTALERAFANMEAAREQEATAIRADGQKQAQIIEADAEARPRRSMPPPSTRIPPSTTSIAP